MKCGILGAVLQSFALGIVTHPAVGLITGGISAYNFGQKWITLKTKEEAEQTKMASSEYGLFLRFENLEKYN
jgi:hypothetical protein